MTDGFRLHGDTEVSPLSSLKAMLALGLDKEDESETGSGQEEEQAGDLIGPYRLISPLGEGGFGTVWKAEQIQPIRRELALKLIKAGTGSRSILARFEAERQALAMMDHPNIAAVLDAGTTQDGRSYFAMELVKGWPLTTYCDERRLTVRERVELFVPVCLAVQHAHQKGIIHRDLKPSNILVMELDGKPVPKVIDFGVAKALGAIDLPAFQASVLYTQIGAVIGTLPYMSPEQAGSAEDVDTRSDIYTLGVILYELLTGSTPQGSSLSVQQPFDEALRTVREGPITTPSSHHFHDKTELSQRAGLRNLAANSYRKSIRGDLDWVTLKALEKDRSRRYSSAAALAEDLERYLEGLPVGAVAPSWHYQIRKFSKRHRLALATASLVSTALIAGTALSLWQASEAKKARAAEEQSRLLAEEKSKEALDNLERAQSAVESYLNGVTEDPRLNQADFSDLRKELLKKALPLYEEILTLRDDPDARRGKADALRRLANLYHGQGDQEKAVGLFHQAIAVQEELVKANPDDRELAMILYSTYSDLGATISESGDVAESETWLRKAFTVVEKLHSSDPLVRHGMATLHSNLGLILERQGRYDEAADSYRHAIEVEDNLIQEANGKPLPTQVAQESLSWNHLARVMMFTGKPAEAENAFRRAISFQEDLIKQEPDNPGHPLFLGITQGGLGSLLSNTGRVEESLPYHRGAIALHEKLMQDFPKHPDYSGYLQKDRLGLALALYRLNRPDEARQILDQALTAMEELCAQYPQNSGYLDATNEMFEARLDQEMQAGHFEAALPFAKKAVYYVRRALAFDTSPPILKKIYRKDAALLCSLHLKFGQVDEAGKAAEDLFATFPQDWEVGENAAIVFSACAEAGPQAQKDYYRMKAVEALKAAISSGYPKTDELGKSDDFAILRDYPPFMALVAGH